MLDKNPIDENLKDTAPLKWVGLMNNYKHSTEEIIYSELISCYSYLIPFIAISIFHLPNLKILS